ncbi:MAG TPA: efflux RND transporter periplasmic adaptor subunit [Isosphaeraceae bacterium]|nr:efflux RND transporter periplasmic adaptor subunit [Isosphaeraceae bacterium]
MAGTTHPSTGGSPDHRAPDAAPAPTSAPGGPAAVAERPPQPPVAGSASQSHPPEAHHAAARSHPLRRPLIVVIVLCGLAYGGWSLAPAIKTALDTISTDDAYVNGHVTFVAPRVSGQVLDVLVDDNMRVKRGSVLVRLDREPYKVRLNIKQAAVTAAEADLTAANAHVRGAIGQARANRFQLERAIEDVNTKSAELRANVATWKSRIASLDLARANLQRGLELAPSGGISKEDLDVRRQSVKVAEASVDQALQAVYASRVGLGLPTQPPAGKDLGDTPPDLSETFSTVRQALGLLLQSAAELGYSPAKFDAAPKEAIEEFYKQDPSRDVERIYAKMIPEAPAIKQAEAKLLEAKRDLAQAELDLRYCDVVSEIDGVVTRRNVNPGNNVQAGQSLMAVRSLTEIWIDANFKETQLGELRIGQRVRCEVDMYGTRKEFQGRITGFTMGTGQTLALLPPQNATGNYVKIVQRLPVRIELVDYDPDKVPLFVGLSVVPYVYFKEPAAGPHAGEYLQPTMTLPPGQSPAGVSETALSSTGSEKSKSGP